MLRQRDPARRDPSWRYASPEGASSRSRSWSSVLPDPPPRHRRASSPALTAGTTGSTTATGQPDGTPLPPDPRSLVTPTYDKAVVFNVAWHWVHGSAAGDLRRAARTPGDRRPAAPRQRGRAGRVGIQRQPSVEPRGRSRPTSTTRCGCAGACSADRPISTSSSPNATARRSAPTAIPTPCRARTRISPTAAPGSCRWRSRRPTTRTARGAATSASPARSATAARSAPPRTAPGSGALNGNNGLADVNLLLSEFGGGNNGFTVISLNRVRGAATSPTSSCSAC